MTPENLLLLAEAAGLGGPLGTFMVGHACRDAAAWPGHLGLSLRLAPDQLRDERLAESCAADLARSGIAAGRLTVMIPEAALREEAGAAAALLRLKERGIRIMLDRFGGGDAALRAAARFPVDGLGVDPALMRAAPEDKGSLALLKAIVAMGRSLEVPVTATGIETAAQYACAVAEGCCAAQGSLFGEAVPPRLAPAMAGTPRP